MYFDTLHQTEHCQSLPETLRCSSNSSQPIDQSVSKPPCAGDPPRLP